MSEETNMAQEPISQEELKQRRENLLEFYNESIPYLKTQLEYEQLRASVEIERLRYLQAQIQMANLMAPEQEEDEEEDQPMTRTLKRTK